MDDEAGLEPVVGLADVVLHSELVLDRPQAAVVVIPDDVVDGLFEPPADEAVQDDGAAGLDEHLFLTAGDAHIRHCNNNTYVSFGVCSFAFTILPAAKKKLKNFLT